MPPREDDVAPRAAAPRNRTLLLAGGFALAGAATLAVLLTDNAQVLKLTVIAIAWAFVLATLAAGRRDVDRVAAAAREAELRHAYEVELDREVAARREYELELEQELRREAEESMRSELGSLRGDIAALSGLRDEVARVAQLRGDIAALSGLRDEVARVAALRDDVAALMALRQDLGQLADLRADMGRLRAELTEQLSSEMLVERIVMRTQASRLSAEPARPDAGQGRTVEGSSWADEVPPRELTGGWPAIRLDELRETPRPEEARTDRVGAPPLPVVSDSPRHSGRETAEPLAWDAPLPTWEPPGIRGWPDVPAGPPPTTMSEIAPASIARPPGPPPTSMSQIAPASIARPPAPEPSWGQELRRGPSPSPAAGSPQPLLSDVRRPPVASPPVPPPVPPAAPTAHSPLDWLATRSQPAAPSAARSLPDVSPNRRRADDGPREAARGSGELRTAHRPSVPSAPPQPEDRPPRAAMHEQEPATAPGSAPNGRLAEILAENGVSPSSGGRRRHRYRDDDEPDDVLARVLGQS